MRRASQRWLRFGGLLLIAASMAAAAAAPPQLPETLYLGNLNATWAADHAQELHEEGIAGIIFEDLIPPLTPSATLLPDEALVRELGFACRRLTRSGITANYAVVRLGAEEAWFSDAQKRAAAEACFRQLGKLCASCSLAGIALEAPSAGPIYDYRWAGYYWPENDPQELDAGARAFGRRCLRAAIRECPRLRILMITDSLEAPMPLWEALFTGMVESVGAAQDLRVDLLVHAGLRIEDWDAFRRWRAQTEKRVYALLPSELHRKWREQGSLVLGAAPFGFSHGRRYAATPPDRFRVQWLSAKTLSERSLCFAGGPHGWWTIPAEGAAQYAALKQPGAAALATPPRTDQLADWTLKTPVDSMQRIGFWPDPAGEGLEAFIYLGDSGAAAFCGSGLSSPLAFALRSRPLHVYPLHSGRVLEYHPTGGELELPASPEPVVIAGLPVDEWALPAGLWLESQRPFAAGEQVATLHFGYRNLSALGQSGDLLLTSPPGYGVGRAAFAFDLPPGAAAAFEQQVRGNFLAGERPAFEVQVSSAGMPSLKRCFSFSVLPRLEGAWRLDGPALGPAAFGPHSQRAGAGFVISNLRGEVRYCSIREGAGWAYHSRDHFVSTPVIYTCPAGVWACAIADHRGRLHLIDAAGKAMRILAIEAPPVGGGLAVAPIGPEGEDAFVCLTRQGRLVALNQEGGQLWQRPLTLTGAAIAFRQGHLYIAATQGPGCLVCLDAAGEVIWEERPQGAVTTPLQFSDFGEEATPALLIGAGNGRLEVRSAESGALLLEQDAAPGQQVLGATRIPPAKEAEGGWLLLTQDDLRRVGEDFALKWRRPLHEAQYLTSFEERGRRYALTASGAGRILCFDADGALCWEEDRACGPLCAPPQIVQADEDRALEILTLSSDGWARLIQADPPSEELPDWARESVRQTTE